MYPGSGCRRVRWTSEEELSYRRDPVYCIPDLPGSGCHPQNHQRSIESCKKTYTEYGEPPTTRVWLDDTSGSSSPTTYTEYGQVPRKDPLCEKSRKFLCESMEKSEARPLCVRCSPYSVYRISSDHTCVADNITHEIEIEIKTVAIFHILYTLFSSIFIRTVQTSCILVFRIQDPCCGLDVWLQRTSANGAPAPTQNLYEILFFSKGRATITEMWIFWTSYTVYAI